MIQADEGHSEGPTEPAPMYATIAGVPVVTIPLEHYAELLRYWQESGTKPSDLRGRNRPEPPRPSTLEQDDPEVAAFLREQFAAGISIESAERAVRREFGPDRVPSYQRCRSFWHKVRGGV